ncbi:hypothetical protein [uncultured Legionella sp.]|uniref:hypothetical protein n=1 Tax=uncultured Legionella sp. TaxID=210934 RepID=UPI002619E8AB|nr:hypothetical protein [uncultured Legionella sp.]
MTGLEDLLYSLTTVIIRYHDAQTRVKKLVPESDEHSARKDSRILAKIIINDDKIDFKTRLNTLIKECPQSSPDRKPFLEFLLNEIVSLKSFLDQKTSFDTFQYEEFKKQLFTLFWDFNSLLSTTKSNTSKVTKNKTGFIAEAICVLAGLVNDGWSGSELCNSGIFLKEEVIERFHITLGSGPSEFIELSEQICSEHQNALLIIELTAQISLTKSMSQVSTASQDGEIAELKEANQNLTSNLSKLKITLYLLTSQYMMLKKSDAQHKKTIEQQEKIIETLTEQVKDLSEESSTPPTSGYGSFFGITL